ncbi:MAG: lyase domain protein repeat-containing protein [Planctomycetaceae bacterium]|nr:lyase domain protein repeat-containing protein [Planctomycetaceae bacterium]
MIDKMQRLIIPRILMAMLIAASTPLLAAGDPVSPQGDQSQIKEAPLLRQDASVDVLIEALTSPDFSTRMRAVDFIGYRGEEAKRAIPALIKALDDSHMRESALHALKNMGPHAASAIPTLFKAFTAYPQQPATPFIAAQALVNIGKPSIPTLELGVKSDNVYERLWSHTALAKIEGPESPHLRVLADAMASTDKKTSLVAVEGLTLIGAGARSLIPEIIAAMDSPTTSKIDLAGLLATMGKEARPAIPKLILLLDHPNSMTTQTAAYALSQIGGEDLAPAVPGLIRMLSADQNYVREMAAETLGTAGPVARQSIPLLIERLKDQNEHVRAAAGTALGQIDSTDATVQAAFIDAMKDESGRVRCSVAPVLARNAPVTKELIEVFVQASDDNYRNVQMACETFFRRLDSKDKELIPEKFRDRLRKP